MTGHTGPIEIGEPADADSVWVSVAGTADSWIGGRGSPWGTPVMAAPRAVVFRLSADRLPEFAQTMRGKLGRCGGFFVHQTREEAEADLVEPRPAPGGSYSIDQGAAVGPMLGQVREDELRSTIETLAAFHNRYYQADTGAQAARWLQGRWQEFAAKLPGASVALIEHGWRQPSVMLTIPGSEQPDEIVVLGGHIDSIAGGGSTGARAPGADDNASGVAVLVEVARILSTGGFRPRRTVQIMGYAAEEVGLRGSKDIAQRYAREGRAVAGVIQFDMTNFKGSAGAIYLIEDNVQPELTGFLGRLIDSYLGVPWGRTRCGYGCSDHASWTRSGFAASAAFESSFDEMNPDIHSDRDTLANSGGDARHSVAFARLGIAFAVELAKSAGGGTTSPASP